jgi:hypothetical protein
MYFDFVAGDLICFEPNIPKYIHKNTSGQELEEESKVFMHTNLFRNNFHAMKGMMYQKISKNVLNETQSILTV